MSRAAILALLWDHKFAALLPYLRRCPSEVFVMDGTISAATARAIQETGSGLNGIRIGQGAAGEPDLGPLFGAAAAAAAPFLDGGPPGSPAGYRAILEGHLPRIGALVAELDRIRQSYPIAAAVLSEESTWLGHTAARWAAGYGIPTIHLSHGTGILKNYNFEDYVCDAIAVFGERSAEYYLDCGVSRDRIEIVGNPGWDCYAALAPRRAEVRGRRCEEAGFDPARPVVVFGTTWNAGLSFLDDRNIEDEIRRFAAAYPPLAAAGFAPQFVVKDRLAGGRDNAAVAAAAAADVGMPAGAALYTLADGPEWLVAADVVVSIDSNLSLEAVLAGTPAVNVLTPFGLIAGPGFGPEDPIVQAEFPALGDTLAAILGDEGLRQDLAARGEAAKRRYNHGNDGRAGERLADAIERRCRNRRRTYVWQSLLDVEHAETSQYHNWARTQLFELFTHPPRRVLDIGCGAGATGEALKHAYGGAEVWGVEINGASAAIARGRIDHVLDGKFEDVDLDGAGIVPGSLDTVIVADVLEHMYDPWSVLVRLKPYLSPDAQVIASIPNVRNLVVMEELAKGNWRYEPWGLLDITHIRFFTLREI
ncbi:MAG TPA: class I SAM-dependent methyltransferase, partial [Rhodocyclaceae bacterium]|nr:class I SAM-dependent methyltransferase [Rhodocyclaceae bacterium]